MLRNLFVTEDENAVMEQFEQEKHKELENELGTQVNVPEVKRGWNEWAGDGVDNRKHDEKVARAQAIKNKRIQELKQKRADFKMKGVIVNTEERDKKFAHKYWVKELPHPYNSVDQHQKVMNMPVGKEWSTLQTYKRLVQPEVLTKAGEIIKPLAYKKEVNSKTIDSLVQYKQNKREKRPAAKF